jgi:hypothetical protein
MVAQTEILRERVQRALERLKSAERYDAGQQVNADCVDQAIRILEGVSDDEVK